MQCLCWGQLQMSAQQVHIDKAALRSGQEVPESGSGSAKYNMVRRPPRNVAQARNKGLSLSEAPKPRGRGSQEISCSFLSLSSSHNSLIPGYTSSPCKYELEHRHQLPRRLQSLLVYVGPFIFKAQTDFIWRNKHICMRLQFIP